MQFKDHYKNIEVWKVQEKIPPGLQMSRKGDGSYFMAVSQVGWSPYMWKEKEKSKAWNYASHQSFESSSRCVRIDFIGEEKERTQKLVVSVWIGMEPSSLGSFTPYFYERVLFYDRHVYQAKLCGPRETKLRVSKVPQGQVSGGMKGPMTDEYSNKITSALLCSALLFFIRCIDWLGVHRGMRYKQQINR